MAKHTEGAVHLTSLDLDLTKFQENIQQIQTSTAEVADVAVQNLSKIREALNVPTEQMRLSVDTTQLTQSMDTAAQSAQNLSQKVSGTFKQIENAGKLTDENISSLLKGLNLNGDTSAVATLKNLRDALDKLGIEYNKISLTVKDGDLFRAVAESADESGRKIQSTFDLTGDTVERIKAQIVESSKQTSKAFKEQAVSVDTLKVKLKDLEIASKTFSAVIADSDIKSTAMDALIQQSAQFELNLQDVIEKMQSGALTTNDADLAYKNLSATLSHLLKLWGNVNREAKNAATTTTTVDEINKLALNYANLAKQMGTTKTSNLPGMGGIANEVKAAEEQLKSLSQALSSGNITTKEATDIVDRLSSAYTLYKIRLADAEQEQNKYVKSLAPIQRETQETISSLKTLEKTAVFKTSKDQVSALRAKYEEFLQTLKNSGISVEDAKAELASLGVEFEHLETSVKRGNGTLENWVNKITESAKWQIANSALNLLQQSFGQLFNTISQTEDAVIELQRVLNEKSLADSTISEELYQIAYDFGQTFESVQETAVRFAQTGMSWQETVEATRATMLGLNTAELEVSSATEGLIGVMAQFHIQASDLETVIDKINITADNFPITSEKIVAALQRAGGTANAFGLSLEETIGVITALGAATGRAGEAIGTAMNSLISFSMKDSSLKKFSEFLGQDVSNFGVLELWTQLSEKIKEGDNSLAQMMSTSEEFNGLFNEEIASSLGLQEEFGQAQEETNKLIAEGKDIYSTVGTYRQNYFIALLNNIAMAQDAIENMSGAVGYSMRENETAMEAFSKKWQQLIISAQQLAVQFGNMGFLDLMKDITTATTSVLQFVQSIGGLKTVMIALSGVIFALKREKIATIFSNLLSPINKATTAASLFFNCLKNGSTITRSFNVAMKSLNVGISGWIGIATTAVTALSVLITKLKQAEEEQKEARKESVRNATDEYNSIKNVSRGYLEYEKAVKSKDVDAINDSREKLITLLGYESEDVDALVKRYGDLNQAYADADTAVKTLTEDQWNLAKADALKAMADAAKMYQDIARPSDEKNVMDMFAGSIREVEDVLSHLNIDDLQELNAMMFGGVTSENAESIINYFNERIRLSNTLTDSERTNAQAFITAARNRIDSIQEVTSAEAKVQTQNENLQDTFANWIEWIATAGNEEDDASDKTEEFTFSLENAEEAIESLNKKMDTFQSSVKSVKDIIKQYNKTGVMTADMLQTLISLSPEYIKLIDFNTNSLSLNEEQLENLMRTNDNYMVQMAAMKVAKEYEALATELQKEKYDNLTAAQIQNMITTDALGGKIYNLVMQLYGGQISADQFAKAVTDAGTDAGLSAAKVDVLTQSVVDYTNSLGMAINLAGMFPNLNPQALQFNATVKVNGKTIDEWEKDRQRGIISEKQFQEYLATSKEMMSTPADIPSSGSDVWFPPDTSKSGGKSNTDRFKEEKEALNDLLAVYEHSILLIEKQEKDSAKAGTDIAAIYRKMQDEVHKQADYYRSKGVSENDELIRDLQKKWLDYQDKIEEALHGIYEETVASHERAIKYLEHQYDSAAQNLNYSYMGENLKKQLDYQVKIQKEAERELERLAELGMDANSEAAQEVIDTWYEASEAIRDISQKIQESILQPYEDFIDLADKFDIWDYMDFTKVDYLRMELQEINEMLEDGTMSLKEYNAQLKQISYAIFDAQKELFDKQKDDIEKAKDEVIKAYKADVDSLKDQKEQVEDYYKSVIDGYNAEIDAWEKRKDKVNEYYDTLIDNLNEVQAANERINAQVDYYNNRQKIVTNLEQAQARSGVEWREKEMEYQQSLIDLDEEWNRTQKEWDIQDQIDQLNKLKEQALADIDLSIQAIRDTIEAANQAKQAAIDSIEAEIAGIEEAITATEEQAELEIAAIDEQFKALSQTIAEAIKSGTLDGVVNSQAELDQALVDGTNAMLNFIDSTNQTFTQTSQETANTVYGIYDTSFVQPMYNEIDSIAAHMRIAITEGASSAADAALSQFRNALITPLKNEMASILSQSEKAKQTITTTTTTTAKFVKPDYDLLKSHQTMVDWAKTSPTVYITNHNLNPQSAARKNESQLMQSILYQG